MTKKVKDSQSFFPPAVKEFFKLRTIEFFGLLFLIIGLMTLVSLISYDPADPSFNLAIDGPVFNYLGRLGSYTADILLQTVGIASFFLSFFFWGWGWRLLRHKGIKFFPLRFFLAPISLLFIALFLVTLPNKSDYFSFYIPSHIGGTLGTLLYQYIHSLKLIEINFSKKLMISLFSFTGAILTFIMTIALDRYEWKALYKVIAKTISTICKSVLWFTKLALSLFKPVHKKEEDVLSDTVEKAEHDEEVTNTNNSLKRANLAKVIDTKKTSKPKTQKSKPTPKTQQADLLELISDSSYVLPPIDLLQKVKKTDIKQKNDQAVLQEKAALLESTLNDFGVKGEIVNIKPGPVVTLFELNPSPGTKSSRVISLADDIARSMSALSVRVAIIPGQSVIGIELPNTEREKVLFSELVEADDFKASACKLALAIGKDIGGQPVITDLSRMPHLLIAGTTGSGKSVSINTLILSLLYRLTPDQCRFIMIDPKMLELSVYDGIPHLLSPVVTDPKQAIMALKWTVREMELRYQAMSKLGVRNIIGYNQRLAEANSKGEKLVREVQTGFDPDTGKPVYEEQPIDLTPLPYIVVIADEIADLMLIAGKDVESAIQRLAQMARAAGIHLVLATQRPSVDVITGTIKANLPSRISFQVTSKIDSRTILGEPGAEQLLGMGDMLYMAPGGRIIRSHGPLVTDEEVEKVVNFLKEQGKPEYLEDITMEDDESDNGSSELGSVNTNSGDELYDKAVSIVLKDKKASISYVQRQLQIGYNRAANLIERMEKEGILSTPNRVGRREILVKSGDS